jgi:hypothetical protein
VTIHSGLNTFTCNSRRLLFLFLFIIICSVANAAKPKVDFNGDGKADLLVGDIYSGKINAWIINGTSVRKKVLFGVISPKTGWGLLGINDANGDNRSDLYWYNKNNGAVATQLSKGLALSVKISYGAKSPSAGWAVLGIGDYNGDNKFDIYWTNIYSGAIEVWAVNGSAIIQNVSLGSLPPNQGWTAIGLRDLNGDGRTDILIYNNYTGEIGSWIIDYGSVLYGNVNTAQGWAPIALEDFDGDGMADLLLYSQYNGALDVWTIKGSVRSGVYTIGTLPPSSGWAIAAFNDLNADSKTDILWYNADTGGVGAWVIGQAAGFLPIGTLPSSDGWHPVGLDDFNGDRKADLLWSNVYKNSTATWLLNSNTIVSNISYGSLPVNSLWTLTIPR